MHKLKTIVADNLYKFNHFKMNISRTFQKNYYALDNMEIKDKE